MKIFNAANTIAGKVSKTPHIAFSSKSGVFRFNKQAVDLMGLKINDQLEFAQDDEKPENWFLTKAKENGFELRDKNGLTFNNSQVAGLIVASLNGKANGAKNHKIKVIAQPVKLEGKEYWPLEVIVPAETQQAAAAQ